MKKIPKSSSQASKALHGRENIPSVKSGYRPSGDRTSECSIPPSGGSSIQNSKNK